MTRSRVRALLIAVALALSTSAAAVLGGGAPAAARSVNPAWNIRISASYSNSTWYFAHTTCQRAPAGRRCENAVVRALNHARAVMGLRKYRLPARFDALRPAEQLLVLVNDDRRLYGLAPVLGRNARLHASAVAGAQANTDPRPVGRGWVAVASNWAAGMSSPLFAYYDWMYGDGMNHDGTSSNLDCSAAHPGGCWGHRDNVLLNFGAGTYLLFGAGRASTSFGASWTQLFQAYPRGTRLSYIPTITGLSTHYGAAAGGNTIRIQGYGFFRLRRVQLGRAVAKVIHRSGTRIDVVVPRHRKGVVHVLVVTSGGHSSNTGADAYAYR